MRVHHPTRDLTPEAGEERLTTLRSRIAREVQLRGPAGFTWLPESDFWRLPAHEQGAIVDMVAESMIASHGRLH